MPQNKAPLKDPFFGIDFVLKTVQNARNFKYLAGTHARFQKYGSTYFSKHLRYPTIHTIDPENVKEVLAIRFEDYKLSTFRVDAMTPFFGKGIFCVDGKEWSHSRGLIRPSFARHNIRAHLETLESHVQNFLHCVPKDGSTIDLQNLFFRFTMDTATEFLLGHSVQTLCGENQAVSNGITDSEFVEAYTAACVDATVNMRLGALQHLKCSSSTKKAQEVAFKFVDGFVNEALLLRYPGKLPTSEEKGKYIFLHELAKDTGDRKELRDQIMSILLAGRDTTASLLSNLFWHLARRPHAYAKLREEMTLLGNSIPSDEDVRNMKYLRQCINEALRLIPSVPANTREAVRDTVLPVGGGRDGKSPVFVKKGTQVYFSSYSMHRREEFFGEKIEEFIPERWDTLRPTWEFLPFNGGPRICLGQQFALTEASYLTVRLIQQFKSIEARDERPWTEMYTMVAYSRYGTLVSLKPSVG